MGNGTYHREQRGGNQNFRPHQNVQKTFEQLAQEVNKEYFGNTFAELLNMSSAKNLDGILESIEKFVAAEGKNLSTSQLRNIYDKAIKTQTTNELKLIRPNLAYIAGRSKNEKEKRLLAFIDLLIKSVQDGQVNEFKIFFEAVVAYHKFYGINN